MFRDPGVDYSLKCKNMLCGKNRKDFTFEQENIWQTPEFKGLNRNLEFLQRADLVFPRKLKRVSWAKRATSSWNRNVTEFKKKKLANA